MDHKSTSSLDGIIVIDKPKGFTSRDVVNKISHILNTKKIGHTGTLDPLATGVLIITIGKCTKLGEKLTSEHKEYEATFELGYETDTLDIEGRVTKTSKVDPEEIEIRRSIESFLGFYEQEVPLYSAVKIKGRRLYDYARNGESVELPKRLVEIKNIEILSIDKKTIKFKCLVSKGTYIRSLIRDIGQKLGTYATMTELKRTKQGKFTIDEACKLEDDLINEIKSVEKVIDDLEIIECNLDLLKRVSNGMSLKEKHECSYLLFKSEKKDIALYEKKDNEYRLLIKF